MTVIIFGSPNINGFTGRLLENFLFDFPDKDIVTYNAYSISALPCIGCNACKTRKCIYRDLDNLIYDIKRSDNIIIATPVYNFSVPSPLKAIFDRFQVFYNSPLTDKQRNVHLCITSGRSGKESIPMLLRMIECAIKPLNGKIINTTIQNFTDKENPNEN